MGNATRAGQTGGRTPVPLTIPSWVGIQKRLDSEEETEFSEFLPFRPRGAQVLVDPFVPANEVTVTGRVLSPAKEIDDGAADPELWVEGHQVTPSGGGTFRADAVLLTGEDQLSFRAKDATGLEGRGYVVTFVPSNGDPEDEDELPYPELAPLPRNDGPCEAPGGDRPQALAKPARYGRTRAEVQRFRLTPAFPNETQAELVLKGEDGSELGRATVELTHEDDASLTEWVCITATDPTADPALTDVEGKVLRVPGVKATVELHVAQAAIGKTLRFSGLDPSKSPARLQKADGQQAELSLGLLLGGKFAGNALALRWFSSADDDDVPLPGEEDEHPNERVGGVVRGRGSELEGEDPVDLSEEQVPAPLGWATLELEGTEDDEEWEHRESFQVLTYADADPDDPLDWKDMALSGRPVRVQWNSSDDDPDEHYPAHPDQVLVFTKEETTDEQVVELCTKYGLHLADVIRRDHHFVLETDEPVDQQELKELVAALDAEDAVLEAHLNVIGFRRVADVATVRGVDYLRAAIDQGGEDGSYIDHWATQTLKHVSTTRALPAQQLVEKLLFAATGTQPTVGVAVLDSGFGGARPRRGRPRAPTVTSPDIHASRCPWGGRNVTGNRGRVSATLPLNSRLLRDLSSGSGHGTASLHAVGAHGMPFRGMVVATSPSASAATPGVPPDNGTVPQMIGANPFCQLLPMRIGNSVPDGRTVAALRFAVQHPGISVVNLSFGSGLGSARSAASSASQTRARRRSFGTMRNVLTQATNLGKIITFAGGEQQARPWNFNTNCWRSAWDCVCPTGPRSATNGTGLVAPWAPSPAPGGAAGTPTCINITCTAEVTSEMIGPRRRRRRLIYWHPYEKRTDWCWWGPEIGLSAPGEGVVFPGRDHSWRSMDGTSFAAPYTAGVLSLMILADRIMLRPRGTAANQASAYANWIIDMAQWTAHKAQPLFTAAEATAQYSDKLGHGRVDAWAGVLSVLNNGPMILGATTPHANLTNLGAAVAPANVAYYGFEIDTHWYRATVHFVNVDTGAVEQLTDSFGLDPICDAGNPDVRQVQSFQLRGMPTDAQGIRVLPVTFYRGGDPLWFLQFSVARAVLARFTHIVMQRNMMYPMETATPGLTNDQVGGLTNNDYWGLPLAQLLQHQTTGAPIGNFHASLQHYIVKVNTNEHDRRLRVTFDRVELGASAGALGDYTFTGSAGGTALPAVTVKSAASKTAYLPDHSRVLFIGRGAGLTVAFSASGPGGSLGNVSHTWAAPVHPDPMNVTGWGLGERRLSEASGRFHVIFRVELEPNLPRYWKAELKRVRLRGLREGHYRFALEMLRRRSAYSASTEVPVRLRVTFTRLTVRDDRDGALAGQGEWTLCADVNNQTVGQLERQVDTGQELRLGWSREVAIYPGRGERLQLAVYGIEEDTFGNDDLGTRDLTYSASSSPAWGIGNRWTENRSYRVYYTIERSTHEVTLDIPANAVLAEASFSSEWPLVKLHVLNEGTGDVEAKEIRAPDAIRPRAGTATARVRTDSGSVEVEAELGSTAKANLPEFEP